MPNQNRRFWGSPRALSTVLPDELGEAEAHHQPGDDQVGAGPARAAEPPATTTGRTGTMHGESPVMRPPRKATARSSAIGCRLTLWQHSGTWWSLRVVPPREDSGGTCPKLRRHPLPVSARAPVGEADCSPVINVHFVFLGAAIGAFGSLAYMRDTLARHHAAEPGDVAPLGVRSAAGRRGGTPFRRRTAHVDHLHDRLHAPASSLSPRSTTPPPSGRSGGSTTSAAPCRWPVRRHGWSPRTASWPSSPPSPPTSWPASRPCMKSWSHPESESVSSYVGAVVNSGMLLLTIDHWTTEVAAFPLFIVCIVPCRSSSSAAGPGPRLRAGPGPGVPAGSKPAATT